MLLCFIVQILLDLKHNADHTHAAKECGEVYISMSRTVRDIRTQLGMWCSISIFDLIDTFSNFALILYLQLFLQLNMLSNTNT